MSAHAQLRAATRDAHDRVDALFASLDLADRDDYAAFLAAQARAYLPLEEALTAAGAANHVEDWDATRRGQLLLSDLTDLGVAKPDPVAPPPLNDDAELIGALYVLEGSRLGGAMLRKSVPDTLPSRFLSARPPSGHWKRVIALLERKLYSSARLEAATAGALRAFALFELGSGK